MGDVIGDLNGRRGKILGMKPRRGGVQVIQAQVPLADDVRLLDRPAQPQPGKGDLHHAVQPLRAGPKRRSTG